MNTTLFIDTTGTGHVSIMIEYKGLQITKESASGMLKAQTVLPLLLEMLTENNLALTDITQIRIKDNQGSMTGIRVGFAVGNALGYLLDIPVNGKRGLAIPKYDPIIYKEVKK